MNKTLQILNLACSCAAFIRKDPALKSYNPLGQIVKSNMSLGDSSEEKEPEKTGEGITCLGVCNSRF